MIFQVLIELWAFLISTILHTLVIRSKIKISQKFNRNNVLTFEFDIKIR